MTGQEFAQLSHAQQTTLLIAMQVRNSMEGFFHVKHLTDKQMAELNPIIRQGIMDAILMIDDTSDPEQHAQRMSYLINMIPDYWEIPTGLSWETQSPRADEH